MTVYVEQADLGRVDEPTLNEIVTTFDDRVFPAAARRFGTARDVDGDGRFCILLSSRLSHLAGGRHSVDGFVRGADFDPELPAPLGNRCDLMYLNAALRPGPHLRTVIAHEYTHAVISCHKGPDGEEGWLDEALAHLVEDLHGFSRSNLDHRVVTFLAATERYRLVVDDYYAADLLRAHGNRGGTYLFLRWCSDTFGPELLPALIRSELRGAANLEAATGRSFADLYRAWSIALEDGAITPDGPRLARVVSGGPEHRWDSAGTASHYVVIESARNEAVRVEVEGRPGAMLQVTAIPRDHDRPWLELTAIAEPARSDGLLPVQLTLRERRGISAELDMLCWSSLGSEAEAPPARPDALNQWTIDDIRRHLGSAHLPPRGQLEASGPILLPRSQANSTVIFRLTGRDSQGRPVRTWAELRHRDHETPDEP